MNREPQHWAWTRECTFPSNMGTAHDLIAEVMGEVRAAHWQEKDLFAAELALEEAFANAIQHGNLSNPEKNVHFLCKLNSETMYVRIEDEGDGFDPSGVADPTDPENQLTISGRGVLLIRHFATTVRWNDRGNVIEFEKERSN